MAELDKGTTVLGSLWVSGSLDSLLNDETDPDLALLSDYSIFVKDSEFAKQLSIKQQ